jgi:hypothetical protein
MCVEPEFSAHGDQALCGDHDAWAVFVRLSALWLIAIPRKVRLYAQCLIPPADVCSAEADSRRWRSNGLATASPGCRVKRVRPVGVTSSLGLAGRLIDDPQGQEIRPAVHSMLPTGERVGRYADTLSA